MRLSERPNIVVINVELFGPKTSRILRMALDMGLSFLWHFDMDAHFKSRRLELKIP